MLLSEIIIERIKKEGPVSFRDFMEMALYYPELGYYNSQKDKIGADGDFYTSANLTAAFGAMIGRQIEDLLENASRANICRYGLHRQSSALMTCIVPSPLTRDHMHFIDGGSGGYAMAASQLKAKPAVA